MGNRAIYYEGWIASIKVVLRPWDTSGIVIDVPLDAYDYIVNGKFAIDWVMECEGANVDEDSGIVDDANENLGDPSYPFDLLRRVITVSLETMKIVRALPPLDL